MVISAVIELFRERVDASAVSSIAANGALLIAGSGACFAFRSKADPPNHTKHHEHYADMFVRFSGSPWLDHSQSDMPNSQLPTC